MKRTGLIFVAALAFAGLAVGCQREGGDGSLKDKLDQIDKRLASIESKLESGAGARGAGARPQRPRRPRPNPNDVYAVNIEGAPFRGAKDAKVTVVEAFEFA